MTQRPLAIDLFCGLGGWSDGLLAEGWRCIGFDIERHEYGDHKYPAQLVIQDVLTLHGSQFRNAGLIVASPPCQEFSYMAMPWTRAKEKAEHIAAHPDEWLRLTALFDACFRIQREACEAAGRHIPLIVENVRGAQRWVGRSRWNYGSFHLWGDVPALMPMAKAIKVAAHLWFNVAHNTTSGKGRNPDGRIWKYDDSAEDDEREKLEARRLNGHKQPGIGGVRNNGKGDAWFQDGAARHGSKSSARKMASAMIAKIPLPLSRHIAQVFRPMKRAA